MACCNSENACTWTFYPSLLSALDDEVQRCAIEEACCAHYCGRYQEAASIFDSQLPPSDSLPLLCFQRADMLTDQGLEHERIRLLQATLKSISKDASESSSVQLLVQLMLVDAEFWALGRIDPALEMVRTVKDRLRTHDMENLSDVDVRTALLYHRLVSDLGTVSNIVHDDDHKIFLSPASTKGSEIRQLRTILDKQKRWRIASVFMQYELSLTSGAELQEAAHDAVKMCKFLSDSKCPAFKFRAVLLQRSITSILQGFDITRDLPLQPLALLDEITPRKFTTWKEFCPKIAAAIEKDVIVTSDVSEVEKAERLFKLCSDAERYRNYTLANQAYIAARDCASHGEGTATDNKKEALALLKIVQKKYISSQEKDARLAFFLAAATSDHVSTLRVKDRNYKEILHLVESFQTNHADFDIPNTMERLLDNAMAAAQQLDMKEKFKHFKSQYDRCITRCSFWKESDISGEATLDPDYAFRKICHGETNPLKLGQNAIGLLLQWAAYELQQNVLSEKDCSDIFGIDLLNIAEGQLVQHLKKIKTKKTVSNAILGADKKPTRSEDFMDRYRKLLDWVRAPYRLPSLQARVFALKIFMEARTYMLRQLLPKGDELGFPNEEQASSYNAEMRALTELCALEATETESSNADQYASMSVHLTLMKAFALNTSGIGLADDSMLVASAEDCRQWTERTHNSGDMVQQYHAICQLLRLTWQRYVQFGTVLPEDIMPTAEAAEEVFVEIRNSVTNLNPPETLIAGVKLSKDLSHREHDNYALAGRLSAFRHYQILNAKTSSPDLQNKGMENLRHFMMWTYKSKGRGYSSLVNIEAALGRAIAQEEVKRSIVIEGQNLPSEGEASTQGFLSPQIASHVDLPDIHAMLGKLPDGVVIVDFTEVKYARYSTSLVAITYRKDHTSFPIQLPNVDMVMIQEWVKKNVNVEKEKGDILSEDSGKKLAELGGLLEPLFTAARARPILPGETVIFCPTGMLNRIPLHAIPVDGKPFIERNPVVYCQSLTILWGLWKKDEARELPKDVTKRTVLNPMPQHDENGKPVSSNEQVRKLSHELGADYHHGFDLKKEIAKTAIQGSSIFHYHGHVQYDSKSAIDSFMVLNAQAHTRSKNTMLEGAEFLTARDLFKIKLAKNALAVIIGCGSGVAAVSSQDDILGFPTALFYAGANAVVSTLWPLNDDDGAVFSTEFYDALFQQRREDGGRTTGGVIADADPFKNALDLAKAFRTAVLRMRHDTARQDRQAAYHWASFTLNGFWFLPDDFLPDNSSTEQLSWKVGDLGMQ